MILRCYAQKCSYIILRCYAQKCSYIKILSIATQHLSYIMGVDGSVPLRYLNDAIPLYIGKIHRSMTQNLFYIYGSAY